MPAKLCHVNILDQLIPIQIFNRHAPLKEERVGKDSEQGSN
jgi:hypothetical protein